MHVLNFTRNWQENQQPYLALSFYTAFESDVKEIEEDFAEYHVTPYISLAQIKDRDNRYEISASNWERVFQLLSVYVMKFTHPDNIEEYIKWSKELSYAFTQLSAEKCAKQ